MRLKALGEYPSLREEYWPLWGECKLRVLVYRLVGVVFSKIKSLGRPIFFHWDSQVPVTARLDVRTPGCISLGRRCMVGDYVRLLSWGGFINVGCDSTINDFCYMQGRGGVTIGNSVRIGGFTFIVSDNKVYKNPKLLIREQGTVSKPVVVGDDVWIGVGCIILPGVSVGEGSVVGAGSVVVEDVPPYSVVVGNPARVVKVRK